VVAGLLRGAAPPGLAPPPTGTPPTTGLAELADCLWILEYRLDDDDTVDAAVQITREQSSGRPDAAASLSALWQLPDDRGEPLVDVLWLEFDAARADGA